MLSVEVLIADMPTYNGKNWNDVLIRQICEAIAEENSKDIIERRTLISKLTSPTSF